MNYDCFLERIDYYCDFGSAGAELAVPYTSFDLKTNAYFILVIGIHITRGSVLYSDCSLNFYGKYTK